MKIFFVYEWQLWQRAASSHPLRLAADTCLLGPTVSLGGCIFRHQPDVQIFCNKSINSMQIFCVHCPTVHLLSHLPCHASISHATLAPLGASAKKRNNNEYINFCYKFSLVVSGILQVLGRTKGRAPTAITSDIARPPYKRDSLSLCAFLLISMPTAKSIFILQLLSWLWAGPAVTLLLAGYFKMWFLCEFN